MSFLLSIFPFFSGLNGYVTARLYKFFKGTNWIALSIITSGGLPLFYAGAISLINICEWLQTRKSIVSDIYLLAMLWLGLNVPVTLFGTFIGFSQPVI